MTSYPDFVDINITCPVQKVYKGQTVPTVRISPDQNTMFTFEVYGYPEPTEFILKIQTGKSLLDIDSKKYSVNYIRLIPPFGQINVTVSDADKQGTITYVLNVKKEAMEVSFKFQAIKLSAEETSGTSIEPIIGGVVGGISFALIVLVVLTICIVKRRRSKHVRSSPNQDSNIHISANAIETTLQGNGASFTGEQVGIYQNQVNLQSKTEFAFQLPKPHILHSTFEEPAPDFSDDYIN